MTEEEKRGYLMKNGWRNVYGDMWAFSHRGMCFSLDSACKFQQMRDEDKERKNG
jgi:hypothetical protein